MNLFGVTMNQFLKTGLIAVLFIVLFRTFAARTNIPGLKAVAGAI